MTADVSDDGQNDLIWRKSTGELNVWFMNGINRTGSARFLDGTPIPLAWRFVSPF
ncbi:MAG: hypothetical protein H0X66_21270 [Verrucomicrobia bacterium]|nr:hypothetical protein [Verrucomicrobiota bacterium]